jgi:FMN-dependent NADH-azoreductase
MERPSRPVLLAIDSSPMAETAVTRRLTRDFVALWRERFPAGEVIYRDVGANPPPHPDALTLAAFGKPPEALGDLERESLRLSDRLVEELIRADHVVIGSPMYNFTVTSGLKAWIDLVGRPGRTFSYGPQGAVGLLRGKQIFVVTARGGFYAGAGEEAGNDFQEGYLRAYFRFMGLDEIHFVHAEGQGVDLETARRHEAAALEGLRRLFEGGVVRGA